MGTSKKVSYDGYKVLRLSVSDASELQRAHEYAMDNHLDVWQVNAVNGWMDVMVAPGGEDIPFEYEVVYGDVQVLLNASESTVEKREVSQDWNFNSFPTSGTVLDFLRSKIQQYPNAASYFKLGTSYEGSDINGIKLGNGPRDIVIHCTIHAREWVTTTTCLYMIQELLTNEDNEKLLESFTWHIIPILNPDGYDYTHTTNRLWRKNRAPNPSSSCVGTDINRNFEYGWGGTGSSPSPCDETYRGPSPFSTPEGQAISSFLKSKANPNNYTLSLYFDIHAYGALWMSPWGYTTTLPPEYDQMFSVMSAAVDAEEPVNKRAYTYGTSARVIYVSSGGSNDYAYGSLGLVNSYVVEAFGSSFTPPTSYILPVAREIWAGVKATAEVI